MQNHALKNYDDGGKDDQNFGFSEQICNIIYKMVVGGWGGGGGVVKANLELFRKIIRFGTGRHPEHDIKVKIYQFMGLLLLGLKEPKLLGKALPTLSTLSLPVGIPFVISLRDDNIYLPTIT